MVRALTVIALCLLMTRAFGFEPGKVDFSISFKGETSDYRVMSAFLQASEEFVFKINLPESEQIEISGQGDVVKEPGDRYRWTAPAHPGVSRLTIRRPSTGAQITLNLFVLVPANQVEEGMLSGYQIGHYPSEAYLNQAIYLPPPGYLEVTKDMLDIELTPNYRLEQFLCRQPSEFPKFLVLREKLLLKLEYLTEQVNAAGVPVSSFVIMSGFRTPYYNTSIRNAMYSRHQWGGAADVFIDEDPKDGKMDDLNKDGKVDKDDAEYLAQLIEKFAETPEYKSFIGGLGVYSANSYHGPFIHVDVRGAMVRW
ncbi:hypothetical protein [Hahella sp. NBU794]|uniref:hypothetical protein n=1 Tax=Hahella sp. NBU794 TaxID=3422590 RepID=UPI003D6DCFB9